MTKRKMALALGAILALAMPAFGISVRGLIGLGAEFGGEKLLSLTYSDGSTSDVKAGQGLCVFGGAVAQDLARLGPVALDLQGTVGLKYSTIKEASNANADFFRFPFELLAFAHWKELRVGVGPAYHIANSFSGSGQLSGYDFKFNYALGLTMQADYMFMKGMALGLRYTLISYEPKQSGLSKVDAATSASSSASSSDSRSAKSERPGRDHYPGRA